MGRYGEIRYRRIVDTYASFKPPVSGYLPEQPPEEARWRLSRASGRPVGEPLIDDVTRPADGVRSQLQSLGECAVGASATQCPAADADAAKHIRHSQHGLNGDPRRHLSSLHSRRRSRFDDRRPNPACPTARPTRRTPRSRSQPSRSGRPGPRWPARVSRCSRQRPSPPGSHTGHPDARQRRSRRPCASTEDPDRGQDGQQLQ